MRKYIVLTLFIPSAVFADCKLVDVLPTLRPGAAWVIRGTDYSGLEWQDQTQGKPSASEAASAMAQCLAAKSARTSLKAQAKLDVKNRTLTADKRLEALMVLLDQDQ